jgi:hypothetical protein
METPWRGVAVLGLLDWTARKMHGSRSIRTERARKKRHTHRDAVVTVAHKLARIAWRMLTDKRPFKKRPPRRAKTA